MLLILALIALDWLYLAWLIKLRPICFRLRNAMFPTGKSNNSNNGHKQICLTTEVWVDLLMWMPPEQLENCQLANARLRDIVDRHRERLPRQNRQIDHRSALFATLLSLHILDSLLRLLLICIAFLNGGGFISQFIMMFLDFHIQLHLSLKSLTFIFHDDLTFLHFFVTLADTIWPRHFKPIVRLCERMDRVYGWLLTNVGSVRKISLAFDALYLLILIVSMLLAALAA